MAGHDELIGTLSAYLYRWWEAHCERCWPPRQSLDCLLIGWCLSLKPAQQRISSLSLLHHSSQAWRLQADKTSVSDSLNYKNLQKWICMSSLCCTGWTSVTPPCNRKAICAVHYLQDPWSTNLNFHAFLTLYLASSKLFQTHYLLL